MRANVRKYERGCMLFDQEHTHAHMPAGSESGRGFRDRGSYTASLGRRFAAESQDEGARDAESVSTSCQPGRLIVSQPTVFVQEPKQNGKTNVANGTLVE